MTAVGVCFLLDDGRHVQQRQWHFFKRFVALQPDFENGETLSYSSIAALSSLQCQRSIYLKCGEVAVPIQYFQSFIVLQDFLECQGQVYRPLRSDI